MPIFHDAPLCHWGDTTAAGARLDSEWKFKAGYKMMKHFHSNDSRKLKHKQKGPTFGELSSCLSCQHHQRVIKVHWCRKLAQKKCRKLRAPRTSGTSALTFHSPPPTCRKHTRSTTPSDEWPVTPFGDQWIIYTHMPSIIQGPSFNKWLRCFPPNQQG